MAMGTSTYHLGGYLGLWVLVLTSRRDDLGSGYKYLRLREMTWTLDTSTYLYGDYGTMGTRTDLNGDDWDSGY